ncbi:MAG: mechanosensitive ion channel family protein [Chloroflexi bacterium]|nr:mechanosensitive ion channel family protein [Chloroflexota bacterium]MBU1747029.1 mechanosensitive ion channel family protein [Chloroflexota bacterium]
MPQILTYDLQLLEKALFSIVVVLLALVANWALSNLIRGRIKDPAQMSSVRMLMRNGIFLISCGIVVAIWLEIGGSLTVAIGIAGAGVAFAAQEVIGSLAGYLNIVSGNLFHIGDRVRIGDVEGDVLDISLLRTTVMEIREWINADQYTGRTVTIANRVVFTDPVFNYTRDWPYLWDEIMIPITYESDWRRAAQLMLDHAQEYSAHIQAPAEKDLQRLTRHYPALQQTSVEPSLYLLMTDNWIQMTFRYVVVARDRRVVRSQLHRELLEHFEQEPTITVASDTFGIVSLPTISTTIATPVAPQPAGSVASPGQSS